MGKASKRVGVAEFHRLTRIVSLMKRNHILEAHGILEKLRELDIEENIPLDCSLKTVYRDIQTLKRDFDAPIAVSRTNGERGYYLKDKDWEFIAPALVDENEIMAAVLGAKIAEDIFPSPLRGKIQAAVDELLKCNNPEFLGDGKIDSLKIFSDGIENDSNEIFMTVFHSWLTCHTLHINYENRDGTCTERDVEPSALVFFENYWAIVGFCHYRKETRTFLIYRMHSAEMTQVVFQPDKKIGLKLTLDKFLNFRKIDNVQIKLLTESARKFAVKKRMHSAQRIESLPDGTFLFKIPAVAPEVVVPWIMSQRGEAIPLEPEAIRTAVADAAKSTLAGLAKTSSKNL